MLKHAAQRQRAFGLTKKADWPAILGRARLSAQKGTFSCYLYIPQEALIK
jgi:hypothetical protein